MCPRCGEVLFEDMNVCYGCLYNFSKDRTQVMPKDKDVVAEGGDARTQEPGTAEEENGSAGFNAALGNGLAPAVFVRTASVDFVMDVPPDGLVVGSDPACDIVLHAPTVSRRHLRLLPAIGGISVVDLGAASPVMVAGRSVSGVTLVREGEAVETCGSLLTVIGCGSAEEAGGTT